MQDRFRSFDEAARCFAEYAKVEPRLERLWSECRSLSVQPSSDEEDAFDIDLYDVDPLASDADDVCGEVWFVQHIKPRFSALVGWYREADPAELRTSKAYDDVYAALLFHALALRCPCCCERAA